MQGNSVNNNVSQSNKNVKSDTSINNNMQKNEKIEIPYNIRSFLIHNNML